VSEMDYDPMREQLEAVVRDMDEITLFACYKEVKYLINEIESLIGNELICIFKKDLEVIKKELIKRNPVNKIIIETPNPNLN
jgi:hypothetical protein